MRHSGKNNIWFNRASRLLDDLSDKRYNGRIRKEAAKKWEKLYNHPGLKSEDINCVGCTIENGKHFKQCTVCKIRKCATERGVKNCAHCKDYGCDTLKNFHKVASGVKRNLEDIRQDLK